jgi:hypothetical protein
MVRELMGGRHADCYREMLLSAVCHFLIESLKHTLYKVTVGVKQCA